MTSKVNIKYDAMPKNAKQVDDLINNAIEAATSVRERIQMAAIGIIHHAYKHGDVTKANELVDNLPNGVRKDALVKFFREYGMMKSGKPKGSEESQFTGFANGMKHEEAAQAIKDKFSEAKRTWWTDMVAKSNPHDSFDINKVLRQTADKISKQRKKAEEHPELQDKINLDIEDQAMEVLLKQVGLDFEQIKAEGVPNVH